MKNTPLRFKILISALLFAFLMLFGAALFAGNEVLGEIRFFGATKVERTAGVWIDGVYIGYLDELKGSKRVLLIPGEHEIVLRQTGYKDVTSKVVIQPGQKLNLLWSMVKDPRAQYPDQTSELKIAVRPKRAAVFVDDHFVGHVAEFDGVGKAMLVKPGKHRVKIILPGYQPFETDVELLANQRFILKTDLSAGGEPLGGVVKNEY